MEVNLAARMGCRSWGRRGLDGICTASSPSAQGSPNISNGRRSTRIITAEVAKVPFLALDLWAFF